MSNTADQRMNKMKSFPNKKAFTLAEVLITLGIIGVVAAMTLPTLLTNIQKHVLSVATRKFHSNISNAIQVYMEEEETNDLRATGMCYDEDGNENNVNVAREGVHEFIREHFKVIKECNDSNADKCFAKVYNSFNPSGGIFEINNIIWNGAKIFVLADGSVLSIYPSSRSQYGGGYPATLLVDVNGQKGPNIAGYDFWTMSIFYDGVVDESEITPEHRKQGTNIQELRENKFDKCKEGSTYGGCFGHFLNNNYKFDY